MTHQHVAMTILDDDEDTGQAMTRAEAEATLERALADCLWPCCTGAARRRRIRAYLRSHAIIKALDVLEGRNA